MKTGRELRNKEKCVPPQYATLDDEDLIKMHYSQRLGIPSHIIIAFYCGSINYFVLVNCPVLNPTFRKIQILYYIIYTFHIISFE